MPACAACRRRECAKPRAAEGAWSDGGADGEGEGEGEHLVALAILFEAARLFAVAATGVRADGLGAARANLGAKRLWVALERRVDGALALVVVLRVVEAALAIARKAVLARGEALAVELEAFGVATCAARLEGRGS